LQRCIAYAIQTVSFKDTKSMSEIHYAANGAEAGSARRAMIESQLRTSGVNAPAVLSAMAAVAREDHVPAGQRAAAYIDRAVPLGNGRFLAAPLFAGKVLTAAEPVSADKALVVTAGSHYLAEVARGLVGSLDTVDAAEVSKGVAGGYSLILIDGAAGEVPQALADALAEGGRIVTGLVDRGVSRLAIGRKIGGAVSFLSLDDLGIPAIPDFAVAKGWSL
jgi:protein-L-isoaspartate(D-aspartate) O-methyltransferase